MYALTAITLAAAAFIVGTYAGWRAAMKTALVTFRAQQMEIHALKHALGEQTAYLRPPTFKVKQPEEMN